MTIEIPLTKGHVAVVDDIDADLADLKWFATQPTNSITFYAGRKASTNKVDYLHRVVLARILDRPLRKGEVVDHRDGDGLNNCRGNLRVATHAQNCRNSRKRSSNTSGVKGVSWYKRYQKWRASIKSGDRYKTLGYFDTIEEAAEAYREAAVSEEFHGEFANFGQAQS